MSAPDGIRSTATSARLLLVLVLTESVLATAVTTQYLAWRWGYDPRLGRPLHHIKAHEASVCRAVALAIAAAGLVTWLALRRPGWRGSRWGPAIATTCVVLAALLAAASS